MSGRADRGLFLDGLLAGLRLEEGLNLQVGDIDAARGLVHVHRRGGTGG